MLRENDCVTMYFTARGKYGPVSGGDVTKVTEVRGEIGMLVYIHRPKNTMFVFRSANPSTQT